MVADVLYSLEGVAYLAAFAPLVAYFRVQLGHQHLFEFKYGDAWFYARG